MSTIGQSTLDRASDQLIRIGISQPTLDRLVSYARTDALIDALMSVISRQGASSALLADMLVAMVDDRARLLQRALVAEQRAPASIFVPAKDEPSEVGAKIQGAQMDWGVIDEAR